MSNVKVKLTDYFKSDSRPLHYPYLLLRQSIQFIHELVDLLF
jgi:hypothetical protein